MTAGKLDVQAIFNEAISRDSDEGRVAYLDEVCANQPELRARVEALLRAHSDAGGFFGGQLAATEVESITERPGSQIGPYKLLQQVGDGGMGVVYMAEQKEPVKRRVALKIIKPGMDTRQVIARFEAERQALALMDHPNIAKVLDAGQTESGRPYFVMELVNGLPVTQYCDEQHLNPRERLELFVPICQAVQHAHQKGIIHRDLKPSNILVAPYDGRPVPKIIDFGVAKATSQTLTEKTMFTQLGQVVGTLEYMSPEQAERNQLDIDTRSDVYSLGVVLYELLTGQTPFDRGRLRSAAFEEVLRIIREEEPSKPSTKVSSSQALPSIAANRRIEPARLGSMIRGELDWIVLKALEKDRARRYETANGFAKDIERYLENETVEACPPSAAYRFRKFTRRNKAVIGTAAVVSVALILGLIGTTGQAIRASRAERIAQHNLDDANEQRQLAEDQAKAAELARQREQSQRMRADENFRRARQAVDTYFTAISENELLDEAGMQPLRQELLEAAVEYYQGFADQQVDDPAVLGQLAAAHSRIAQIFAATGSNEWPDAYARCLDIVERLQRERVDPALWAHCLEGSFRYGSTTGTPRMDQPIEALRVFERGMKIYGQLAETHHEEVAFQEELATNCLIVALIQGEIGQREQAISNYRRSLQIWTQLAGKNAAQRFYANHICIVLQNLPWLLRLAGRGREAAGVRREGIATLREIYGDKNAELAKILERSASELVKEGRLDEAEDHFREALRICENLLDQQKTPRSLRSVRDTKKIVCKGLGKLLARTGRPAEAEQLLGMASDTETELASQTSSANYQLAVIDDLMSQGKLTAALEEARAAARLHPTNARLHGSLMTVLNTIGDGEQTLTVMRENARLLPNSEPAHHHYGLVLKDQGRLDDAVREFERGLEIIPKTPWSHHHIAEIRLRQDRLSDALDAARSAIRLKPSEDQFYGRLREVLNKIGDDEKTLAEFRESAQLFPDSKAAHLSFGAVLKDQGQLDEAIREFERAIEIDEKTRWSRFHIAEIRLWQNRLPEALDAVRSAVRLEPNEYRFHALLLEVLNKIGDDDMTLTVLRENTQLWPDSEPTHHIFGHALEDQGRLDEAAREFERGIEINPDAPWLHKDICEIRLRQNRLPEALEAAKAAVRINPTGQSHDRLLDVLNRIDDDEKTLAVMKENAQLLPDSQLAHVHYGLALQEHGRVDEAAREFALAIEIDPDNPSLWINRGSIYASLGQLKNAASDFAKAAELERETFRPWYLLALSQLASDDQQAYRRTCAEMLERFQDSQEPYAHEFTAWTCALAADAVEDYEGAIALAKREANLRTLGAVLYRAGRFDEALAKLLEADAMVKSPDRQARSSPAYAWFFLTMTYHRLGNAAEAHKYLERAQAWTDQALEEPTHLGGGSNWFRLLTLRLLRDEAEQLIGVEADTLPAEVVPADEQNR